MIYSFGEESNKMEGTVSQHAMTFPTLLAGDITKHSALKIAFYQQHQQESLPYDKSSLQYLTEYTEGSNHNEQTLRAHLGAFGLSGDLALQTIGLLSGGQKARVVLAALTISKPHLLLLDEPTNNLDLDAVKAMKEALNKYNGAFIVTSHDMAFIEGTAEVVYYIVKGKLTRLEGGVDDYKAYVRKLVEKQKSTRN